MKRGPLIPIIATLGFLFLYAPIISLIVFSFNESKLVTVWGGFSTKWYGQLFADPQVLNAGLLSLRVAAVSASIALILGTLCGVALTRFRRFRGKTLLAGLVSAPLVMPDVITGLSLLLLFVAMESIIGWPAGQPMIDSMATNSSSRLNPVMTSGITSGAETRPASSVLPRKRRKRVSATPQSVPRISAMLALTAATRNDKSPAFSTCGSANSWPYHLVEKPPHTVTSLLSLNEKTMSEMIGA